MYFEIITIIFSVAAIASGLMRLFLLWAQTKLAQAIGADLCISIYRRTLYQPYTVHFKRNSSKVIAGIHTKANSVSTKTISPIFLILSSCLISITILSVLLTINSTVAISAFFILGLIYIFLILFTRKYLAYSGERIAREENLIIKALQEGLGGIRDVIIDGTQETTARFTEMLICHSDVILQISQSLEVVRDL